MAWCHMILNSVAYINTIEFPDIARSPWYAFSAVGILDSYKGKMALFVVAPANNTSILDATVF
jgi:hypothetical protein